jgi:hypothetical protein
MTFGAFPMPTIEQAFFKTDELADVACLKRRVVLGSLFVLTAVVGGCQCAPPPGATFREVTDAFVDSAALKHSSGGFLVALLDDDDVPDLVALSGYTEANNWSPWRTPALPSMWMHGRGDGRFDPGSLPAGVGTGYYATASAGDFDRDGHMDLVLPSVDQRLPSEGRATRVESGTDHWLVQREGVFVDRTADFALPPSASTLAACQGDFDNDGFLDVYLANYRDPDTFAYDESGFRIGQRNAIYRGGIDGTMSDVSSTAGAATADLYWSDACVVFDYDGDGLQDLWVANDGGPLQVFRNVGGFTFEDVSTDVLGRFGRVAGNWMGFALGDVDSDGDSDVFATNFGVSGYSLVSPTTLSQPDAYILNALLRNNGNGTFVDVAPTTPVTPPPVPDPEWQVPPGTTGLAAFEFGWAAQFADYDNDGDLDLYWNGNLAINRSAQVIGRSDHGANPGRLLQNNGDGSFSEVGAAAGIQNVDETGFILNGWGSALVDLDRDGWLDLIVGNQWFNDESYPGGLRIWHNEGGAEVTRHWVGVKLVARVSNPSALGARVSVSANGRTQIVDVASQSSISTVGPLPVHVGIGDATTIDAIVVRWPGGAEQRLEEPAPDQIHVLEEP